uniref:Uncharacterized protein n=1 Tax=Arundo donax TaxID=35708 RepID=A0A0A9HNR4_ARUDO
MIGLEEPLRILYLAITCLR